LTNPKRRKRRRCFIVVGLRTLDNLWGRKLFRGGVYLKTAWGEMENPEGVGVVFPCDGTGYSVWVEGGGGGEREEGERGAIRRSEFTGRRYSDSRRHAGHFSAGKLSGGGMGREGLNWGIFRKQRLCCPMVEVHGSVADS